MATKDDVVTIARNFLRDFPRFFQIERPISGRTYSVGHVNVSSDDLWVALFDGSTATEVSSSDYSVNERDGVIRIASSVDFTGQTHVLIEGTHFQWLTPSDLEFYAQISIELHEHNIDVSLANAAKAVVNVVGIGAIVHALWGLLTEYSRDVDVIASESVHIPASQRFRMVQSLLAQWQDEYEKYARSLNIGLDRAQVLNLRRRSRTTERLVPVYRERELGDWAPLERVWGNIESGKVEISEETDDLREDVYVDSEEPLIGSTNTQYYPGYGPAYY